MKESRSKDDEALAALAVDYWKLLRMCERLVAGLSEDKSTRASAQLRYSAGRLEQHLEDLCLALHTFEGQLFGPELPVVAINGDELAGKNGLVIDSAVEPAVILDGRVVQSARVIVKEGIGDVSGD